MINGGNRGNDWLYGEKGDDKLKGFAGKDNVCWRKRR